LLFSGCTVPKIIVLNDPLTPEEHLKLGMAYDKDDQIENAVREYKLAAKSLGEAHLYLGNLYVRNSDLESAERHYRKALRRKIVNADLYNNLAWVYYLKRKNLREAERLALEAIALNPARKNLYQDTLDNIRSLQTAAP
jgi:Flp pilus assembly protein TadD